ncbi:hypothetical protein IX51_03435 [uncultured archaeon]|nr:hypothetical protein IX51_03435 [uncultured archaeon]HKJ96468.1 DUF4382 domain-containing protein [Thermoplasmataceae archaeon]
MKNSLKIAAGVVAAIAIASGAFFALNYNNSSGTLKVYVHDLPATNVSSVYITFSEISIHGNQSGWKNYSIGHETVNILGTASSSSTLLKSVTLNAEKYTMIRLYIQTVNVTIGGKNITFNMSSPYAFINHPFDVKSNSSTTINFDFHLNKDLNLNSKVFTPNIGYSIS